MEHMEITVCICAFNEAQTIEKSIRSVFTQKLETAIIKEVIVVSSACTDGTDEIVTRLSGEYPVITLLRQKEREGKNSAINMYLERKTTEIVVMLNADNVFATEDSLEKLIIPFHDEKVGITGGRPVPVNRIDDRIGYMVNLMWLLHHNVAVYTPKLGEIIAFRDIGTRLRTDLQSDEDIIRMNLEEKGYCAVYVPECVVWNKGPETYEDLVKQRFRVNVGECTMRKLFGYRSPTWNFVVLSRALMKSIPQLGFHPIWLFRFICIERKCRIKAVKHIRGNGDSMAVWEPVDSTKKV